MTTPTAPTPAPADAYAPTTAPADAYAAAGVSFSAGDAAIEQIADAVKQTHTERVVAGVGSFGGVFDLTGLGVDQPLLVSSTDTCGTKTVLAAQLDMWDGIGADIVNHGVNDVLVQGARPLFMLDTISAGVLDPDVVGRIVRSIAAACAANGCVLIGGETAEVPDLIVAGGVDVAGTMIGIVGRNDLLPSPHVAPGDVIIGLASSGLHTNGYSLARRLGAAHGFDRPVPGSDVPLGEALLAPHRSYLAPLASVLDAGMVKALAHLTGGGFVDNIPRCLPAGLGAEIDTSAWETPPLFAWLQEAGGLGMVEAHRIFNMGIGMVAIVAEADAARFASLVDEPTFVVGRVVDSPGVVLR
jgi:phosphoribosylformylglycinamidine cyclo-ligase